jgi:hypothetical protein
MARTLFRTDPDRRSRARETSNLIPGRLVTLRVHFATYQYGTQGRRTTAVQNETLLQIISGTRRQTRFETS